MNFIKNIWNKISKPKGFFLVLFYFCFVLCATGTVLLVVLKPDQTLWHYILYALSAIGLTYFVYTIVYFAPRMKQNFIALLQKNKFTNTLLENYGYRTIAFSIFSFTLNIAYVIFMGVLAFKTQSIWYISITTYYLVLGWMRGNVLHSKRKYNTDKKQTLAYRFCGIMFIFLTFAMSGIIVLIYTSNMYFEFAGIMIYVIAAYTFYKLTSSIINLVKARQQDDLYVQSIRNVNLADAVVSIMVLQVAMFQAFAPQFNTSIANALTGAAMSAVILTLGIIMIIKANKILKQMETKNEKEE